MLIFLILSLFAFPPTTGAKSIRISEPAKGEPVKGTVVPLATELSPPLFLSQGGAGGASLKEDFSYLINPAVMGFQRRTKGALAYSFKQNRKTALLSFVDLKTKLPMAFTYQRFWSDSFKKSEKDTMLFSSGFRLSPYFSFGINVEQDRKSSEWNGGIGSVLLLSNQLSLALFLNQILKKENKNQRALSLAFYYNWKNFLSAKVDISRSANRQEWVFKGGLESLFQNFLSIRLGGLYLYETQKGRISGGIAFYSPRILLEYSVEADQKTYQQALVLNLQI